MEDRKTKIENFVKELVEKKDVPALDLLFTHLIMISVSMEVKIKLCGLQQEKDGFRFSRRECNGRLIFLPDNKYRKMKNGF